MNKKSTLFILALWLCSLPLFADGGMWTLDMLQYRMDRMKEMGLQLSADEIYNTKGVPALKDGVVFFDGGCTGVLVSDQSLLLTNHHCGYDQIQKHSTVQANYLRDGFMSASFNEELPCPGLESELVEDIKDVTQEVLDILKRRNAQDYEFLSEEYLSKLAPEVLKTPLKKGYRYEIKAFYGGNKYYLFINKVFKDVRLVAAPPSSIGKFGADTDNWIWPRHTGDFSIFRLYADENGNSFGYDKNNKPYKPKKFIQVSGKGVKEGDFAMIMGFPGTTYHYFTDAQVQEWGNIDNNIRIEMRGIRQNIMLEAMRNDEKIEIQYAAKYASSQNGYKRAQGANWAIQKKHLVQMKRDEQNEVLKKEKALGRNDAAKAVEQIAQAVKQREHLKYRLQYLTEGILMGIEFAHAPIPNYENLMSPKSRADEIKKIKEEFAQFYNKDYNAALDKKIAKAMLKRYCLRVPQGERPYILEEGIKKNGSVEKYVDEIFKNSIYASPEKFNEAINKVSNEELINDPMSMFVHSVWKEYFDLKYKLEPYNRPIELAHRQYVKVCMELAKKGELWPDANLTLRFTFGQIKGYIPRDVVTYGCMSTLNGVMEKEDPTNPEYIVPKRLKEIFETKDYGPYANANGTMPVNFCATTHTTGGNSGSPVFNAQGQLIGLNFDRNWEGVGGDIEYLPNYQRSIILDIRYLMLIVDKYAGGKRLINEMNPVF